MAVSRTHKQPLCHWGHRTKEEALKVLVKSSCDVPKDKEVACVFVKLPYTMGDICDGKGGSGFVVDNDFVKFTGYTCTGTNLGFDGQKLTGDGGVMCNPALTPLAVGLIIAACIAFLLFCICCVWCCCCR